MPVSEGVGLADFDHRATVATRLHILNGVSGRHIRATGHSDVSTTMIYTHVLSRGGRGVLSPLDA